MNQVLGGYFLGFHFWKVFFWFSFSRKLFFGGSSEIPNSADPCLSVGMPILSLWALSASKVEVETRSVEVEKIR